MAGFVHKIVTFLLIGLRGHQGHSHVMPVQSVPPQIGKYLWVVEVGTIKSRGVRLMRSSIINGLIDRRSD